MKTTCTDSIMRPLPPPGFTGMKIKFWPTTKELLTPRRWIRNQCDVRLEGVDLRRRIELWTHRIHHVISVAWGRTNDFSVNVNPFHCQKRIRGETLDQECLP